MPKWSNSISTVTLEEEGLEERNGIGAIRRITLPGMTIVEKITHFEAPHNMRYTVLSGISGLKHYLGALQLCELNGGTQIR